MQGWRRWMLLVVLLGALVTLQLVSCPVDSPKSSRAYSDAHDTGSGDTSLQSAAHEDCTDTSVDMLARRTTSWLAIGLVALFLLLLASRRPKTVAGLGIPHQPADGRDKQTTGRRQLLTQICVLRT